MNFFVKQFDSVSEIKTFHTQAHNVKEKKCSKFI